MAKNQRESEAERRKTDGGICTIDVSPVLTEGATAAPEIPDGGLEQFDILLTKVNLAILDRLTIGSSVSFKGNGAGLAAYTEKYLIGHVSPRDRGKVHSAIGGGGRAWIRDIYDKGIAIRIER